MTNEIISSDWYKALLEDIASALAEGVYQSRWTLIEAYHAIGRRILEEKDKAKSIKELCNSVTKSLGKKEGTLYKAVQFVEKYPDIGNLPEGKNISWHKIVNKYLPEHRPECQHTPLEVQMIPQYLCRECGKKWLVDPRPLEEKIKRGTIRFPQEWYDEVLTAYQKLKKIELKGEEYKPAKRDIKTIFMSQRTPEEIIRCMKWLASGEEEWSEQWTLGTVFKKLAEFLAKDNQPKVGFY